MTSPLSPSWVPTGVTFASLLGFVVIGGRALRSQTYRSVVATVVVAILALGFGAPNVGLPVRDARVGEAIVAVMALSYAVARYVAMLPERRRWLAEAASDPLVLAAPFQGRWRVAAGGPDPGRNHHLIASDQRFAYDFMRSDAPSLDSAILAPITGRVVSACDGMRDHRPSPLRVIEDSAPLGNHVAIDSGHGVVFLCHLRNGSIAVREGDSVVVGTLVGRCGNSGRTTQPHLHIHAQDLESYAFDHVRGIPIAFVRSNEPRVLSAGASLFGPDRDRS